MIELLELELLLTLLLDEDELILTISELLETDEDDGIPAKELELLTSDEDITADDELEGTISGALLLEIKELLLILGEELFTEDFDEDTVAKVEDLIVPVPGVVPPPPPQAVKAADRDTAETRRKE